ncbi:hypothetical protein HMSSN036_27360 [Paenibacillus macerans]|nr:hypothetical protein HMSSN036_27360 [Paenibacillus macerans]
MNNLTMEEEASGVAGLKSLWPSGIKNRLFLSILLFVLVPSSFLQLRSINQLETNMKANISQQNVSQLNLLKNGMEDIRISVLGAMLQLEREPGLKTLLLRPDDFDEAERTLQIGNQLLELKQGLGNALIPVHITLADNYGHVYTTTEEGVSVRSVTGSEITGQPEFKQLSNTGQSYAWAVHESRECCRTFFRRRSCIRFTPGCRR